MNQTARIISIYAADTSGFCSALYEYGGMTVIHDASGCNSTYTTHDEPRWYDKESMMYISGFTERDAIMGNDDKFIHDLCIAASELKPSFVAICASPLPAMTGVDLDAIAYEVENETGIPSFNVRTNGMQSYITGAGNAFVELAKRFAEGAPNEPGEMAGSKGEKLKVNILGLTPLDFPLHGTNEAIEKWLNEEGCVANAFVGMNTSLDEIRRLGSADVSLVVSSIGRPIAEYLYENFSIPYVIGTPYGIEFAKKLTLELRNAAEAKKNINAVVEIRDKSCDSKVAIVGESVTSASLAAAIYCECGRRPRVLESVGDGDMSVLISADDMGDVSCDDEDILEQEIKKSEIIIADPLFEPICGGKSFVRLPHAAFSGRCFTREEKQLIGVSLSKALKES